jgi:hypothetical protein
MGFNPLLVTGVMDQPAATSVSSCGYPVAPLVNQSFAGCEFNGGASSGMREWIEVSRDLIGAESKPGTVGHNRGTAAP